MNVLQGLSRVDALYIHNRLGSAKSFAALKITPYKRHVLHKNHVLAGPLQGLFASYRITLSMVAGGTRRRRFNKTKIQQYNYGGFLKYGYPQTSSMLKFDLP